MKRKLLTKEEYDAQAMLMDAAFYMPLMHVFCFTALSMDGERYFDADTMERLTWKEALERRGRYGEPKPRTADQRRAQSPSYADW